METHKYVLEAFWPGIRGETGDPGKFHRVKRMGDGLMMTFETPSIHS